LTEAGAGTEPLAAEFERERAHLRRVAYAILGSLTEADDVVQETWLRLLRVSDRREIRDLRAWLTTVASRVALDTLESARVRREEYVGPWLPEPIVTRSRLLDGSPAGAAGEDPADRATLDESVSMALLIVLERLSPAERTASLLHDVFGFTFDQAADATGRSPASARKLAERARRHVDEGRPRFEVGRAEQLELVGAFVAACDEGDLTRLVSILDPDVVWRSDGGGKANAARRVQRGAEKVARALLALARGQVVAGYVAEINGVIGLVTEDADGRLSVISFAFDAGRIAAIDIVRNPDKLAGVPAP